MFRKDVPLFDIGSIVESFTDPVNQNLEIRLTQIRSSFAALPCASLPSFPEDSFSITYYKLRKRENASVLKISDFV